MPSINFGVRLVFDEDFYNVETKKKDIEDSPST